MDPYGAENITTVIALAVTVWMITARIRGAPESNWPLFYYLGIVLYSYLFEGAIAPRWIYFGVVTALFMRFEFMGGFFLKIIRVFEFVVLAYMMVALGAHAVFF